MAVFNIIVAEVLYALKWLRTFFIRRRGEPYPVEFYNGTFLITYIPRKIRCGSEELRREINECLNNMDL